ncbi:MAG: leucine-rich repeat domain-containing protein [Ruminococcaceae bacterium]|nr:leucine-rich repeat domain-containing protein [Oscillospiraceae bacterium]
MMKNLKGFCVIPLLLLLLCALVACAPCKHKDAEWEVVTEATCTVAGTKHKVCADCGEVVETKQYETGHVYQAGYCKFCGRAQYDNQYFVYEEVVVNGEEGYELVDMGNSKALAVEIPPLKNGKPILSVADRAFMGKDITSVHFGKNVQRIGERAFAECESLETVTFTDTSELTSLGVAAFEGCVKLKSFAFPAGVTVISARLFSGCTALKTVTLHDGIRALDEEAFADCEAIDYAQENGAKYLGTETAPHLFLVAATDTSLTSFAVPQDTRIIASGAFSGCAALQSVALPEGLLAIGPYAFAACTVLENLQFPTTLERIDQYAFAECTTLQAVTIPQNVAHIGAHAFDKCTALSSVFLPTGLRTLGEFAFYMTDVEPVAYGGGLYLGNTQNPYLVLIGAEQGATSLTLHADTAVVADSALVGSALTSFVGGAGLVTIGVRAFASCYSLASVTITPQTGWKTSEIYGQGGIDVSFGDAADNAARLAGIEAYQYWYRS